VAIGWGIIGIGHHADQEIAPVFNRIANTNLVAVCSRDIERAKNFATKHRVKRFYDSFAKMLEDPGVDAVFIATPNSLHAQHTIQAAEASKHVLCDKPMALTVRDSELMVEACNKNKVKLAVFFQHRYHPAHIEARRYIQSGIVGGISVVKAQLCHPGSWKGWKSDSTMAGAGSLMGQGVHCIDLLRYFLDSEVTEVRAMTDEEPPARPVDEMAYVILKFENGAHGVVISGIRTPPSDNDAVLYGSKAKVTCKGTLGRPQGNLGQLLVDSDSLSVRMSFPSSEPLLENKTRAVEAFNKSIEENAETSMTGHNGIQVVKITNAIIESSRQGKAVKIAR
jgi:1,5-anhydro-D-fructose reductase (1,5-anhydro-D-mannitol-forming)